MITLLAIAIGTLSSVELRVAPSTQQIFQDETGERLPPADRISLSLARNEHEGVQLVFLGGAQPQPRIWLEVPDLLGPDGAVLPAENVHWYIVEYIPTHPPEYQVQWVGNWPDPLWPGRPFEGPAGRAQPIWIDVYAPEDLPAGTYQGRLRVVMEPPREVPLEIRVFDFTLPRQHHLKTAFSFSEKGYAQFYNVPFDWHTTVLPPEVRRKIYGFLLDHRLDPTNIYRPFNYVRFPHDDDLAWCVERGLGAFQIGRLESSPEYGRYLREYTAWLKAHGWLELAYIYGPDEIQYRRNYAELKAQVRRDCGFVHEIAPEVPVVGAIDLDPDLFGAIDIFCPVPQRWDPVLDRRLRAAGKEVWWYWADGCERPGLYLDNPALDARLIPWMCRKYGIAGFLYYFINYWSLNYAEAGQPRWPERPWDPRPPFRSDRGTNGSGVLVYPGPHLGDLVSSIRLENFRDGLEDFEYFWLLEQVLRSHGTAPSQRRLLEVPPQVIEDRFHFSQEERFLQIHRGELAEAIEASTSSAPTWEEKVVGPRGFEPLTKRL